MGCGQSFAIRFSAVRSLATRFLAVLVLLAMQMIFPNLVE